MMLIIACNNGKENTTATDTDPILTSNPNLKSITEDIQRSPEDAALYFQRGNILYRLQYDSLALKDFKKAAALDTTKAEYYSAVGDLLFENKDITGSLEWLKKAIAKNPEDQKAHLKMAKMFLYMQDYAKAFGEINIVLRKDVYNSEAYFLKGMVYKDMKDTAKAISSFQTAVQVLPDSREAIIQLGLLYSAKKDPIALKYLDNAFKADSTDVFPIFAKGVYHQANKNFVAAKEAYKECILRNNQYTDAFFNLGFIYMQQDSVQKAWRQFDMAVKTDPTNPSAYYNRGVCSEALDSLKNAFADYQQALQLDPQYASPKEALKSLQARIKS
jgi:tetratricopeptide (TPR) repeat protein